MQIETETLIQTASVTLACFAYLSKTIYELYQAQQKRDAVPEQAPVKMTPEQVRDMSEVVAAAVATVVAEQLANHGVREERQLERLIGIEGHEADRAGRVEAMLGRLATVTEYAATANAEHYRTIMERLGAVERQLQDSNRRAA